MAAYLFYLKLAGVALLVAVAAFGSWYATSDHYEKLIADNQVKADKRAQEQLAANQQMIADKLALTKAAEETHAKDQLVVNDLTAQLGSVRIHIPTCRGTVPKADTSGADSNGAGGIFPDRVDELFAGLQARVSNLVERCDQLNTDARQSNEVNSGNK